MRCGRVGTGSRDPVNTEQGWGASGCTLQGLVTLPGMLSKPRSSSGLCGCLGKADSSRCGPAVVPLPGREAQDTGHQATEGPFLLLLPSPL